ncbi:hypothetical protein BRAS3843_50001 [Bradyrhizobium sp. STM 3843]|nr:hypothetical protein BRAS3843_50001 [Bradyrhizobium sp. STM 3843]
MLNLYRELIALRRRTPCLTSGDYIPLRARNDLLTYLRVLGRDELVIVLNLVNEPRRWECEGPATCLLSTDRHQQRHALNGPVQLQANEGLIVARRHTSG